MQPYKSIFANLSTGEMVNSDKEAEQIVDISNLEWHNKTYSADWDTAVMQHPPGYRLPTIQELYTAFKQGVPGFQVQLKATSKVISYWSESVHEKATDGAWAMNFFKSGRATSFSKQEKKHVRYVKDKS